LTSEGFEASIRPGVSGQFDVLQDGELVFSKHREHRFPEPDEVLASLRR
jgi:selT/selW/selH-like putative selenoprotein